MRRASWPIPVALLLTLAAASCIIVDNKDTSSEQGDGAPRATARVAGRSGVGLTGNATFTERESGVVVEFEVRGAPPGWHAVHVHENGDCSAPDGTSAGGHFNPTDHVHGAPHAKEHHLGDLGNMWVEIDGTGYHVIFMPQLTVLPGPRSVQGRSLVIHAAADDLQSQPSGAAGARIGCGVIR